MQARTNGWARDAAKIAGGQVMRLGVARLCLDCEEVHEADRCPVCGSETFAFLKRWVKPAASLPKANPRAGQEVPAPERLEQLDTYEQLLKPDREQSRKGRLIAGGALGLAFLGAARLAWRVGKTIKGVSNPEADAESQTDPIDGPPRSKSISSGISSTPFRR
jgi:hypothetical protein